MDVDWADRILTLRERLGLSQTELAEILNVKFQTVNRWENRRTGPSGECEEALVTLLEEDQSAAERLFSMPMTETGEEVGARIKRVRKSLGFTRELFARLLHVTPPAIYRWEAGLVDVRSGCALRMLDWLEFHREEAAPYFWPQLEKGASLGGRPSMGAGAGMWPRCGNSAFFEQPGSNPPDALWINPVDIVMIVTNPGRKEDFNAGSALITARYLPEINLEMAKAGLHFVLKKPQWNRAMAALGRWKGILETGREENSQKKELVGYFVRLPDDDRNAILEGMDALFAGKEHVELYEGIRTVIETRETPEWTDIHVVAMEKGSPAHQNQTAVEEDELSNRPSVIEDDLMTAYWNALQDLGLWEC